MGKVSIFYFMFLILGGVFTGCSFADLHKQKTIVAAPKVELVHSSTVISLNGTVALHTFRTAAGQSFDEVFRSLPPDALSDSQVYLLSNLKPQLIKDLSDQLYRYGFKPEQISQTSSSGASSAQMTLKLYQSALVQSVCYDGEGQYRFGCAVNWNRATSLHENKEIQRASAPGFSPGRLERPSNYSKSFKSNAFAEVGDNE